MLRAVLTGQSSVSDFVLGLALYLPNDSVSLVFMIVYMFNFLVTCFTLHFSELEVHRISP